MLLHISANLSSHLDIDELALLQIEGMILHIWIISGSLNESKE